MSPSFPDLSADDAGFQDLGVGLIFVTQPHITPPDQGGGTFNRNHQGPSFRLLAATPRTQKATVINSIPALLPCHHAKLALFSSLPAAVVDLALTVTAFGNCFSPNAAGANDRLEVKGLLE